MVLPSFSGRLASWKRGPHGGAGRNAHKHALLVAHGAAGGKGVVVLDGDDLVVDPGVEDVGHKAGAVPWILCGPAWPLESTGEVAGSTATT